MVAVGFWNLCNKYSAFVIIKERLEQLLKFFSQVSSQLKGFETFSLILNHDEKPVFLENLLFWEMSDLSIVYCILKMGSVQASDKSMPSCTHAATLKEICSYDRA